MLKRLNVFILVVFLLGQTIIGPIGSTAGLVSADGSEGADKTELEKALQDAEDVLKDAEEYAEEDYTEESYGAFADAVTALESSYEAATALEDDATEDEINDAVNRIKRAIDAVKEKGEELREPMVTQQSVPSPPPVVVPMNTPPTPAKIDVNLAEFNITIGGDSVDVAEHKELAQGAEVKGSFVFEADLEADGANITGAWFEFELPDTILDFGNSFSGSQPATPTQPAFEYSVSGQTVKVTLTEAVDPDLVGNAVDFVLDFDAEFDLDGDGLGQELEIPKADGTSGLDKIQLTFKPSTSDENVVQKKSNGVTTENGERYIEWEVWVNKNGQNLNNATLEDNTLPFNGQIESIHTIVDNSVNVTKYPIGLEGYIESQGSTKFTNGNFSDLTMNGKNAYKVTYKTLVSTIDGDGDFYSGSKSFYNVATVKESNNEIGSNQPVSQSVTFGTALDKKVKSGGNYEITWEIIYNYNEAPIDEADAVITDTIEGPHILDGDIKVYEVTVNDSGVWQSEIPVNEGTAYDIDVNSNQEFELKFLADTADGNVTKAYRVEYDTIYDHATYPDFVVEEETITNKVESEAHDEKEAEYTIKEEILTKGYTVDFDTKEIEWTITIKNNSTSEMTAVKVDDDFTATGKGKHTLVGDLPTALTISGMTVNDNDIVLKNPNDKSQGFEITNGTIAANTTATIKYKTTFEIGVDGSVNTEGYNNKAKVDWKDPSNNEYDLTKNKLYKPEPATANNGIKKGKFDYEDQEFTWQIQVNTNKQNLAGAVLEDTVGEGHEILNKDASSFTVQETILGIDNDEFDTSGDDLDESLYTLTVNPDGKGFTLTFKNEIAADTDADKKVYLVTYKTVDSDDILGIGSDNENDAGNKYTNEATFTTQPGNKEFELPKEDVEVKHANKLIDKPDPTYQSSQGTYTWTLNVNHSRSSLGEVTVSDTPSDNLMLLPGSIEYAEVAQLASGNNSSSRTWESVEENDDFDLTYTEDGGFVLNLGDITKKAIDIRYTTLVLGQKDEEIKNEASIEYSSEVETSENQKTDRPVQGYLAFSASSAHASVKKGSIKIVKTGHNEATGAIKELEGVKFQLIKNISGTDYIIKEGTTDSNGELTFKSVSYGTFTLREETPDGYKAVADDTEFKVNEDNDFTIVGNEATVVEIVNEEDIDEADMCPSFIITVEDLEGNGDPNKPVKLVNERTGEVIQKTTDEDGKIVEDREDLPAGKYTVYDEDDIYIGEITVNYEMENDEECSARVAPAEITVTKTWVDDNDSDGKRSEEITINLLQNDSVIRADVEIKPDTNGNWTHTFTGLTKYDNNNKEYVYKVTEHDVPGYAANYDQENYEITNTRAEKKSIEITKAWKDTEETADRPDEIEVELFRSVDGGVKELVDIYTVKAEDGWSLTIDELPSFDDDGKAYTYEIEEIEVDGYKSIINGFNITNLRVGTTDVSGTKTWVNKHNESEALPESITINLLANGEEVDSVEVTAEDDWKYNFTDLDKYDDNGVAYEYTIEEIAVEGYATSYDGYDITNTRYCEKFTVEVRDHEDKPVTNEKYTFTSEDGKTKVTGTTDKDGKIVFDREDLPEGTYTVTDKDGNVIGEIVVEYSVDCADNLSIIKLDKAAVKEVSVEEGDDSKLPKTATQIFSYIALGLGLIALGITVKFTRRRKTV